jgi:hypothetical protein
VSTGILIHGQGLKLAGAESFRAQSKAHFMWIAAKTMRFVLTEAAGKTMAFKRGGKDAASLPVERQGHFVQRLRATPALSEKTSMSNGDREGQKARM